MPLAVNKSINLGNRKRLENLLGSKNLTSSPRLFTYIVTSSRHLWYKTGLFTFSYVPNLSLVTFVQRKSPLKFVEQLSRN